MQKGNSESKLVNFSLSGDSWKKWKLSIPGSAEYVQSLSTSKEGDCERDEKEDSSCGSRYLGHSTDVHRGYLCTWDSHLFRISNTSQDARKMHLGL